MRTKTWMMIAAVVACLALAAGAAMAQDQAKGMPGYSQLDANHDGKVSKEEFAQACGGQDAEKVAVEFATVDANADGVVTAEEYDAYVQAKKAQ